MTAFTRFLLECCLPIFALQILSTTIYLHRHLSHRAISWMARPLALVFRVFAWLAGVNPRQWVAVHRKHHKYADTPKDPHSPLVYGYTKVLLLNAFYYRRHAKNPKTIRLFATDIRSDKLDDLVFDRPVLGPAVGVPVIHALVWIFGFGVSHPVELLLRTAATVGIQIVAYLIAGGLVNSITHRAKHPNARGDYSSNNVLVAIYTAGEGLHGNHHLHPERANFGLKWWQFDPAFQLVIRPLGWLRLIEV